MNETNRIDEHRIDATIPMKLDLAEDAGRLNLTLSANATKALKGLQAELEQAARTAFDVGNHFAVGPLTSDAPDPFSPYDITRPVTVSVECKAGPVDDNFEPPAGWRVYKRPDDWKVPQAEGTAE
jgi:post-segregation antitoxin (ccd killing protein)